MMKNINYRTVLITGILALNLSFVSIEAEKSVGDSVILHDRIYELRTYTTHSGKLDDLQERFNNHTVQLFVKHGMINVGYWVPIDCENTLLVLLSHNSREAAEKNWEDFRNDPEWQKAFEESRADGPLVSNSESIFMKATPYSQMR